MSETNHVWCYIKDFAIYNSKRNYYFPIEILQYIYSYVISDELKKNINNNFITYNLDKQLDNNRLFDYMPFFSLIDKVIGGGLHDEVSINMKNIPYPCLTSLAGLFFGVTDLVDHKKYSYITYNHNEKYWGDSYRNREIDGTNYSEDRLLIKLYSN